MPTPVSEAAAAAPELTPPIYTDVVNYSDGSQTTTFDVPVKTPSEDDDQNGSEEPLAESPQFPSKIGPLGILTPENVLVPIDQEILHHKNRVNKRKSKLISQSEDFSGVVLVAQGSNVLFAQSYGSDSTTNQRYNADTKFLLSSATKQFTATLVLKETERENPKISLTDPIAKFFDHAPPSWRDITIQKLLAHTSGLGEYMVKKEAPPCYGKNGNFFIDSDPVSRMIARFKPCKIYKDTYKYANTNYFLLTKILERVTHKTYAQLFNDEIASPLGMSKSGAIEPEQAGSRAQHYLDDRTPMLNGLGIWYLGVGNVYSSIVDLFRWEIALFGDDPVPEHQILKPETLQAMITPQSALHGYATRIPNRPGEDLFQRTAYVKGRKVVTRNFTEKTMPVGYGYGLRLISLEGDKHLVFHAGHIDSHTSLMAHYVEDKITIIILTNTENAEVFGLEGEIAQTIFGIDGLKPREEDQRFTSTGDRAGRQFRTRKQAKLGSKTRHKRHKALVASKQ